MKLIITCARHLENDAKEEVLGLLQEEGDQNPVITITDMQGILVVSTIIDPFEFVRKIMHIIEDEPWKIRYILRVIPIEITAETNIEKIGLAIPKLCTKIKEGDTYRVTLEKRNSSISSTSIISKIASLIPNKVSLENPDWHVLIEVLEGITGISILKKDQIISVPKLKRNISE